MPVLMLLWSAKKYSSRPHQFRLNGIFHIFAIHFIVFRRYAFSIGIRRKRKFQIYRRIKLMEKGRRTKVECHGTFGNWCPVSMIELLIVIKLGNCWAIDSSKTIMRKANKPLHYCCGPFKSSSFTECISSKRVPLNFFQCLEWMKLNETFKILLTSQRERDVVKLKPNYRWKDTMIIVWNEKWQQFWKLYLKWSHET